MAVMAMILSATGLSQGKSGVMLYVGMGKVKMRPRASPSIITSQKAIFSQSISCWKSP
ncbi:hypothetical protein MOOR_28370 [Moorella thermoacetica]|uniref:Uncharacterized protein n=1 Tax=Neomoorella thermoacetica TaxID=1525 RepID=A0A1J5JDG1_NEOTH|nr:hypothetical protein MOOR_28370 [Moorella thermoacetica]